MTNTYNYLLIEKENFEEYLDRLDAFFVTINDSEDLHDVKKLYQEAVRRIDQIERCLTSMNHEIE